MVQEEGQIKLKRQRTKQAITLAMEGKWREAVAVNEEIVGSFPEDVDAYNRLGRAYMEVGDYSRAKEAYEKAIGLDPYNTIAEKNIRRLTQLSENGVEIEPGKFEPKNFIEETGKAGVVNLINLARPQVLAAVVAGDMVYLKVEGASLIVQNGRGVYLGQVEPRHAQRLIKLMDGGNRYSANIISSSENSVTVIIREVYQHPSQAGQLSFPTKEEFKTYAGDRMLRREVEPFEEEFSEEPEYTGVSEEGDILGEGFHDVDDKVDSER